MIHLLKTAAGCASLEDLIERQKSRAERKRGVGLVFVHRTRNTPKRADEVLDGGSIYWIIKGAIRARQPIVAIGPALGRTGRPRCGLTMAFPPIPTLPAPRGAIQGWRYLDSADAPPDLAQAGAGASKLPPAMADELQRLGLL
jgi:hypothetical protein